MLTSIPGARLSWHFAEGSVFEPAIVGPDIVDYALKEGPHAARHGIQHFYCQQVAPGVETPRSGARRVARSSILRGFHNFHALNEFTTLYVGSSPTAPAWSRPE
jgi:hypothetical protein